MEILQEFAFKEKNILIISPQKWGECFVSKHHYARELSKSSKVVYLQSGEDHIYKVNENLTVYSFKKSISGMRFYPKWLSGLFCKYYINVCERDTGINFDVIISFDNSKLFNLIWLKNVLRISFQIEYDTKVNRDIVTRNSDFVFCTHDFIKEKVKPHNKRCFVIGHGYNPSQKISSKKFYRKKKFSIGLLGNFCSDYLDLKLMEFLILKNPEADFNFFGPYSYSNLDGNNMDTYKLLSKNENVSFHGKINPDEVVKILSRMDCNIVTYNNDKYYEQISNPHKMLELLGAGKTILSTPIHHYLDKTDLIIFCKDKHQFNIKLKEVLYNLDNFNSKNKVSNRISYANKRSYNNIISKIENIINEQYLIDDKYHNSFI